MNSRLAKEHLEFNNKISLVQFSNKTIKELLEELKTCDKRTLSVIVEYLNKDNQTLIETTIGVLNKDNSSDVIQFISGGITRNNALIKLLSNFKEEKKFLNKLTGETKTIS